ncbi:MAG: DedA family protein [Novosphingobium sp.]|nr:DedA family protein [Novosphingobium sp.]
MHEWVLQIIEAGGYAAVALMMAAENLLPPVPSELILGVGGIAVARGTMDFWWLLIAGTLGSTAGNWVLYRVGGTLGYERLHPIVQRYGRWLTVEWDDIRKASRYMRRHGEWIVFALRFAPFLRTLVSFPAGLAHMPAWKFLLFTVLGSAFWNAALIMGGMWLGRAFGDAQEWLSYATIAVIALCFAAYFWRVFTWRPSEATA